MYEFKPRFVLYYRWMPLVLWMKSLWTFVQSLETFLNLKRREERKVKTFFDISVCKRKRKEKYRALYAS